MVISNRFSAVTKHLTDQQSEESNQRSIESDQHKNGKSVDPAIRPIESIVADTPLNPTIAANLSIESKIADTSLQSTSAANRSIESGIDDSPIPKEKNRSKGRTLKPMLSSSETDQERDNILDEYVNYNIIFRYYCNFNVFFSCSETLKINCSIRSGSDLLYPDHDLGCETKKKSSGKRVSESPSSENSSNESREVVTDQEDNSKSP